MAERIDAQAALDVLARQMWIANSVERGEDAWSAAESWDDDALLTDTYEKFEGMAREAIRARAHEKSVACDGSLGCAATVHLHGCYADKANCDEPQEHRV